VALRLHDLPEDGKSLSTLGKSQDSSRSRRIGRSERAIVLVIGCNHASVRLQERREGERERETL